MGVENKTLTKMPSFFCFAISTKVFHLKDFLEICVKKITPTKLI